MDSREKILSQVRKNQPGVAMLPDLNFSSSSDNIAEKFSTVLVNIGGAVLEVSGWDELHASLVTNFTNKRIVTTIPELNQRIGTVDFRQDPHLLENVALAVLPGKFAVAENGAVWITDEMMGDRALPFICENLALVIRKQDILPTLNEAYQQIGMSSYNLGTFIAGPSKTADIEQSLVLGAHGAKSLVVYLMK
ncbi:LUD domain-containing protein [Fulvivirgaceae bacterium PWU4]|uniref:LUD domain-containing protein n=1 Tax=Chryseosolibacter histidini TaxID=2782349 RepID=A0AAP2GQR8_9BACT|nr:LUD domain-containing protein [Chryseosolibacter histidini]MBT1700418.1 LUD domain-containing protein [Chryseosolibacter histidini]